MYGMARESSSLASRSRMRWNIERLRETTFDLETIERIARLPASERNRLFVESLHEAQVPMEIGGFAPELLVLPFLPRLSVANHNQTSVNVYEKSHAKAQRRKGVPDS